MLGRGARVRGRVGGDGDLRVEGQIEGDVRISGQLAIEEGAAITGDVEASAVVIGGALTGDVAARGAVTIRAGAKVEGNLGGSEIVLEEGASFQGRIDAEFDLPAELLGSHEAAVTTGPHAAPGPGRRGRP
ncbi:MAG: polymer-forming cytoskeletal protein [Minicystis sp.]